MKNRFQGYKQKVLGKQALTFEFDIVPCSVADIPAQVAMVSCVWQRGSKLQYTNAAPVDTERKAYWNQVLKVTATLYRDSNKILPKEYVLKVQSVKSDDIRAKRTTIGKCEINLADYCTVGTGSTDVPVRLRPYGTVQLSITATHVASSKVEQDGMSDVSFMSSVGRQSMGSAASSGGLLDTEQDLEGFDEEAERRQQATAQAASKGRSPLKQGRNQAELGPGPLATGLTGSGGSGGSNTGGGAVPAHRRMQAATANLQHAASTPTHAQTSQGNPFKVQEAHITRAASAAVEPTWQNGAGDAQTPDANGASSPFARDPGGDVVFTPDLPPRSTKRTAVRHKRTSSSPLNLPVDIPEHSDGSPTFADAHDYDRVIKESYATLKSSDDEEESAGIVRSVKTWWGGPKIKQPPKPDPNESPYGRPDPALQPVTNLVTSSDQEYEAVMREEDVQALQQKCRQLLRQRDADRQSRRQDLHHLERLQAQCESLGRAKAMMAERLAISEAKLLKMSHEDVVQTLVDTKMTLAQSEFQTLELQGRLKEEQARSSNLMSRLSAMESDYMATSNIDLT